MFVFQVTAQQALPYVLVTVPLVLVLVQHIAVQQVMLIVQVLPPHVAVQEAEQSLIVLHVLLTHMVYADIQPVVVILAAKHTIMVSPAPPVTLVAVALVLRM